MTPDLSQTEQRHNDLIFKLNQDMGNLQLESGKLVVIVDRIESTIDRLTGVSSDVSKILAVHESKLNTNDILQRELVALIEKRRHETELKTEQIQSQINSMDRNIKNLIEKQTINIIEGRQRITDSLLQEVRAQSNTLGDKIEKDKDRITRKITELERWFWITIGVGATLMFLVETFGGHNIGKLLGIS